MPRRLIALCLALTGLAVLVAPAGPVAAAKKKTPKITKVSPMRIEVGDRITIRGKNFSSKRKRNTVFFRGVGGRQALAKPIRASRKKLVVKVPSKVARILKKSPTRIKLRVLAGKFSKYTSPRLSPVVVPEPGSGDGGGGGGSGGGSGGSGGQTFTPAPTPPAPACPSANGSADDDGDLLENSLEATIGTNPCDADSEDDGVEDGFEYKSAVDLNDDDYEEPNTVVPYPGQRPYPNPLSGDANVDHDGDSLNLVQEYAYWKYAIAGDASLDTLFPLYYSAGEQYSIHDRVNGRRQPALAASGYQKQADFLSWASGNGYRSVMLTPHGGSWWGTPRVSYDLLDFNRDGTESVGVPGGGAYRRAEVTYYDFELDGWLSDNERDEDGDGLTNFDEQHGRMQPSYWAACYGAETAYSVAYVGTDPLDSDSDNDGVLDGADDQDHDDIPNVMELSRIAASGLDDTAGPTCAPRTGLPAILHHENAFGRVNPFNPCLPQDSRTCVMHPGFGGNGAPYDGSPNWYSLN